MLFLNCLMLIYSIFNPVEYTTFINWKETEMFHMEDFYKPSHLSGLTSEQVRIKTENGKQNIQPEKVTKSTGQILKDNICTLFNLFNVLIAIALALVGAWFNMLFILIIALNTLIGIVQELHAKNWWRSFLFYPHPQQRLSVTGTLRKSLCGGWWKKTSLNWKPENRFVLTRLFWQER